MNIAQRIVRFLDFAIPVLAIVAITLVIRLIYNIPEPTHAGSIVKVLNTAGTGGGTGWATKSSQGRPVIVTNDHVCAVETGGYVVLEQEGGKKSIKAILARNFERDLCVIEGLDIPALDLASNPPRRFDPITVFGHPLLNPTTPAYGQYVADGIMEVGFNPEEDGTCRGGELMTSKKRPPNFGVPHTETPMNFFGSVCVLSMELSYTTVSIYPGNSGSPVTNADGDVVGVINSASPRDNRGNFIPLVYVREILEE